MKLTFVATVDAELRGGTKSLLATIALLRDIDRQLVVRGNGLSSADGVPVDRIPAEFRLSGLRAQGVRGGLTSARAYSREARAFFRAATRFRPDVVHCNDLDALAIALPCATLLRARVVLHVRDVPDHPAVTARALAFCDAGVAVSAAVAQSVGAAASPGTRGRIRTIHNPLAAGTRDLLPSAEARRALGLDAERPAIGYVGAFEPRKGQLEFLSHVWPRLTTRAQLALIGSAADAEYQQACADRVRAIGNGVRMRDYLPDVESYFSAFDVLVLASTHEGLPRVALECAAAARPAVLFDVGGAHEAVHDGVTGRVIESGNWPAFAAALDELLANARLREQMGRAAAERARTLFGGDLTRAALLDLYSELVRGSRQ